MSADTRDKAKTKVESEPAASRYALVFAVEEVVVPARQAEYEALRHILEARKAQLTPALYTRYALQREPQAYLPELLAALGLRTNSLDTMAEEVRTGINMFLASPEARPTDFSTRLIQAACARGMTCALRTRHTEPEVRNLLAHQEGIPADLPVLTVDTDEAGPTWQDVVAPLQRTPAHIIAVVSSQTNLQAALAVGLHGLVVPDRFTAFQDFSGADCVIDDPSACDPADILDWWV